MRYFALLLVLMIPMTGCTKQSRQMFGGTAIVVGGLGAVSAAQVADSNPECLDCEGDTEAGLLILGASVALALIGVAIIAIEVEDESADETVTTQITNSLKGVASTDSLGLAAP